jgi:hypothetical protein
MDEKLELANETGIFPVRPEDMPSEDLARLVVNRFNKFREFLPYLAELRKRFAELPRGHANIMGCKTWTQFCNEVLGRTDSAVRKALAAKESGKPAPPPKNLLLAIKRALPFCYEKIARLGYEGEVAPLHFSVSEDGNLKLESVEGSSLGVRYPEVIRCEDEIQLGIRNESSEPFDFVIDILQLLDRLEEEDTDPVVVFHGPDKFIEFRFGDHGFRMMPHDPDAVLAAANKAWRKNSSLLGSGLPVKEQRKYAAKELFRCLPQNIDGTISGGGKIKLTGLTLEQLERIVKALQPATSVDERDGG